MKLIVGLGNPGGKYQYTKHNVGFIVIDQLIERLQLSGIQKKFHAEILRSNVNGQPFIFMKPMTFMNLSGQAVAECVHFYKIPLEQVVVISDDMDLEPDKVRFRNQGGHGGHNGLRSIIEHLGSKQFKRVRIGIGHPPVKMMAKNYVLSKWEEADFNRFQDIIEPVLDKLIYFLRTSEFENTSIS